MKTMDSIVLSCEHAGRRIPTVFRSLFAGKESVLDTHRAFDIGILPTAERISKMLGRRLFVCHTSRLLIDVNRSPGHPHLYSEFSWNLSDPDKERLVQTVYDRHRKPVERQVRGLLHKTRSVLHLSLHSFTPVLHGKTRNADIGILYDPARGKEAAFSLSLQRKLRQNTDLRVRRNYPYRGVADGFTTYLRRRFDPSFYLGIEIEFNQKLLAEKESQTGLLAEAFCDSLKQALDGS